MIDLVNWAKDSLRIGHVAFMLVVLAIGVAFVLVRPRWGRRWLFAVLLGYWFVSSAVGSATLVAPLDRGFHSVEDPREASDAGAIVVLGGGIRGTKVRSEWLAYPHDATALRILEAVRLFRLLGGRPFVVASGGFTAGQEGSEGAVIAEALRTLQIPPDRIILDESSRNTHDQAFYVTRELRQRGIRRFVLVTSPTHMARAARVFRAQGADVVPSPAALLPERPNERWPFTPNEDSLRVSDEAVYEYVAFVYYWAHGWFRPAVEFP